MSEAPAISYDEIPYESQAFQETHPDHLAVIARLYGLNPAPPRDARVLELGCASGGNLIPLAYEMPGSRLVGVDLSSRQIADGRAVVERLGLTNVELRAQSLADLGPDLGRFDYIICHGVYSWVPPDIQEQILRLASELLEPTGLAMVSYNVYPGWHALQMIREMMLSHAAGIPEPSKKVAAVRSFLDAVLSCQTEPMNPFSQTLRREVEQLRGKSDSYLLHEYLEEYNQPIYFEEFVARASRHGLAVVADARLRASAIALPLETRSTLDRLAGQDPIRLEQYNDFARGRTFRRSILAPVAAAPKSEPDLGALNSLRAVAAAGPVSPLPDIHTALVEEYRTPNGQNRVSTNNPLIKAAFGALCERWPRSVPIAELHAEVLSRLDHPPAGVEAVADIPRDAEAFHGSLWSCHVMGVIDLRTEEPPFVTAPASRPHASPYARHQAESGKRVTNLLHRLVDLTDFERLVLRQLDGESDRQAIVDNLVAAVAAGTFPITRDGRPLTDAIEIRQILDRSLDACLLRLTSSSLLIA